MSDSRWADDSQTAYPRLFYFEEAVDAWVPWIDGNPQAWLEIMSNGDDMEIRLKRIDMTDAEFKNLPEG